MGRYQFAAVSGVCLSAFLAACSSNSPQSPVSPAPVEEALGPSGESLKIAAPATLAPAGGVQADAALVLSVGNVTGTYATFPVTYRYEVRSTAGAVVATGTAAAVGGASTSIPVNATLQFDTPHTWRVRAEYAGKVGPWSGDAAFRSGAGGYIRGSEVFDPLTTGITAGATSGPVTFMPGGGGLRLETGGSYVAYELPVTLQEGEFSFMATNVDEGNPGDKSKVMSMAEGFGDVTDNDYRQTLEVRGRDYQGPTGTVSYRIITGDAREEFHRISDAPRTIVGWVRSNWYFFKMWWRTGSAGYEIREGSPNGPLLAGHTMGTSGHPYRPIPHVAYLGSPNTRAGFANATHAGMTVKNVWISNAPRPKFPGE
jgi:hypothetical protein